MATKVQSAHTVYSSSPNVTAFPSNVTAGNLLLVFLLQDGNESQEPTVTDSRGNTWTSATWFFQTGVCTNAIYYAVANSSGACTVTTTSGGAHTLQLGTLIYEFSGVGAFDKVTTPVGAASGGTPTAPNLTGLNGTDDLVFYWAGHNVSSSTVPGGIWTADQTLTIGGGQYSTLVYAVTGPTVTGPTFIGGASCGYNIEGIAFKGTTVNGTGTGAITFGGSGTATVTVAGTGTGAITFAASGTATVIGAATGTGAIAFGGSGAGSLTLHPTGTGAITFAGSGIATVPTLGTGAITFAGSGISLQVTVVFQSTSGGVDTYGVTCAGNGAAQQQMRVLSPTAVTGPYAHGFLWMLPVEPGQGTTDGDSIATAKALGLHNLYNLTCIQLGYATDPWYADNPLDPSIQQESFTMAMVNWAQQNLGTGGEKNYLVGFSKSGIGGQGLIFRHPTVFAECASWDAPFMMNTYSGGDPYFGTVGGGSAAVYGNQPNFVNNYQLSVANQTAWRNASDFATNKRIWIGGYNAFQVDVVPYDAQLTSLGILHDYSLISASSHNWAPTPGWVGPAIATFFPATTGTGAITFGGTGVAVVPIQATGTGAITFGGTGTAGVTISTNGTGAISFDGLGNTVGVSTALGTGAISFDATGAATAAESTTAVAYLFTPPIGHYVPPVPADKDGHNDPGWRLMKYHQPTARGVNVFKLSDGTYPRDDVTGVWPTTPEVPNDALSSVWGVGSLSPIITPIDPEVIYVYYGGHSYLVDDAEAARLTAAGYGSDLVGVTQNQVDVMTAQGWGFDTSGVLV